ncbi:MBL fold metallo-hydrolase [Bermanella sp. WJH001]|uniref:MBL fold metallo-hydrolase n=1 Tax=Bermanella sp. WJH001 TaxID=3048005 RepID=UPI0024BD6783|nr:MBL fold metallo-hydrolase [Bermanella sp. WJH001]MDJ1537290.1 MBL fold metallo-hydrolase [Bermanella sp. WJH001]
MHIQSYYHHDTQTFCHLVIDDPSKEAVLIDPVADYKANTGKVSHEFSDEIIQNVGAHGLTVKYILETHVHADHLSDAQYIKQQLGGQVLIGEKVTAVQQHFDEVFGLNSQKEALFDGLVSAGDTLSVGGITLQALATPGHTPACLSYVARSSDEPVHVFVGDTLFMPDVGTARCDFPGGDAKALYQSIQSIYALGDDAQLHMCHDYPPKGREVRSVVSVKEQKADNIHCAGKTSESEFTEKRQARDANLDAPRLILPSLQVNVRAGYLPEQDKSGRRFLKIPLR